MNTEDAVTDRDEVVSRHILIVQRRLDELEAAIKARDWDAVEWEYDRVNGAVDKLHRAAR